MALLEGWAIAFMFRRWRAMRARSLQWKIQLGLQLALLLALPLVATPYLLASQLGVAASQLMPLWLLAPWSFLLAALAPLVLAGVGYADSEPTKPADKPVAAVTEVAIPKPITFSCPDCGKNSFSSQSAVNAHMRIHK